MRPTTTMQSLGAVAAVIRRDGPDGRLRRGGDPVASGSREDQLRAPCRQLLRHRRRRRRGAARQQGSGRQARPEAACKNPRLCQYRLGARDDADRSGRRHRKAVRAFRHEEVGHRPVRTQRGLCFGGAALHPGVRHRSFEDQRQWRRDRARPSARRDGRDDPRHRARRTGAHQQVHRAGDAVHRRRHGHGDDHREGYATLRRVGKGAAVPTITHSAGNGGHAALCPPYEIQFNRRA